MFDKLKKWLFPEEIRYTPLLLEPERKVTVVKKTALAAAKAEIDALKAKAIVDAAKAKADSDLAKATYVKEFNALAKKWNAKFPKLKVTLKK